MFKSITHLLSSLKNNFKEFTPKSYTCIKEGYTKQIFLNDVFAGISVGIISVPLAMAFAIASGVTPERGLFTAIIAGFIIALLGGSRVQIGGPTGAFVIIIYAVVQRHGYDGLALATLIAGILIFLMGIFRFGSLLKFIPYPVITGFTAGIALTIFSSQIKDFFGLDTGPLPVEFIEKWSVYISSSHTWDPWAVVIGVITLGSIFSLRRLYPRLPFVVLTLFIVSFAVEVFDLPIETIGSKYGTIPNSLPLPSFPHFDYEKIIAVFPDAITIALLGAIESLLSAVIADGMLGTRHRSNTELLAQGLANIGSVAFGGIPATNAIARTAANIRFNARTPLSGMVHSITILLLMVFFAKYALMIPLPALGAVLMFIAWNMSEIENCIEISKGPLNETIVMVITFLLTILIDLTVAVQVGVVLAALIFMKRMTDATKGNISILFEESSSLDPNPHDAGLLFRKDIPDGVMIFEIEGPLFYGAADILNEAYARMEPRTKIFILRLNKSPLIDITGIQALKKFNARCQKHGVTLVISGANALTEKLLRRAVHTHGVPQQQILPNIGTALKFSKQLESVAP